MSISELAQRSDWGRGECGNWNRLKRDWKVRKWRQNTDFSFKKSGCERKEAMVVG